MSAEQSRKKLQTLYAKKRELNEQEETLLAEIAEDDLIQARYLVRLHRFKPSQIFDREDIEAQMKRYQAADKRNAGKKK